MSKHEENTAPPAQAPNKERWIMAALQFTGTTIYIIFILLIAITIFTITNKQTPALIFVSVTGLLGLFWSIRRYGLISIPVASLIFWPLIAVLYLKF